jgi:hypothetical protein
MYYSFTGARGKIGGRGARELGSVVTESGLQWLQESLYFI